MLPNLKVKILLRAAISGREASDFSDGINETRKPCFGVRVKSGQRYDLCYLSRMGGVQHKPLLKINNTTATLPPQECGIDNRIGSSVQEGTAMGRNA